jgi:5-guanidino-2-oxopentanoate decarboxylase
MERPLGAQISHMLKDRGVTHIFGIPGVHNQEMYRGIEEAGLTHILARHEQGAGFMADGYARASGKPGVCYVITGPGLTNIMTPMGQAYSDSVPMLVISSCLDETAATRGQLHQMKDQRAAAASVCDWSQEARTAEAAYALIDRALLEFETSRPRPKHLTVPIKLLEARASPFGAERTQAIRAESAKKAAQATKNLLRQARRPVFIFGGGASGKFSSGANPVPEILTKSRAASFMTYAGRGVVPMGQQLSFGSMLAQPSSADIFAQSDLVIVVGSDLAEVDLWRKDTGHTCRALWVNIDPDALSLARPDDQAYCCDASNFLVKLATALKDHERRSEWTAEEVSGYRKKWRAEIGAERPGIVPVADALRDCLPTGTMIYSDMTQFAYAAKEVWDMERPGHWHHPTGFGTLGYATPAAIGGALARPGLPTMAIIGDYGFQYTLQELATAVELELSLPIFLWDNDKLGEIEASMVRAQIAPNAVHQRNPDFIKLAEAYGAAATTPLTLTEMQSAVRAAFAAKRPTVIRVTPNIQHV